LPEHEFMCVEHFLARAERLHLSILFDTLADVQACLPRKRGGLQVGNDSRLAGCGMAGWAALAVAVLASSLP
jgi:hypothetical protein